MTDTRQGHESQPPNRMTEAPRPEPKEGFRLEWVLIPLALLGMVYLLGHTEPAVTWEQIMDLLHVKNRERYTMLFHLCLALTCVVAAIRILGRKDRE